MAAAVVRPDDPAQVAEVLRGLPRGPRARHRRGRPQRRGAAARSRCSAGSCSTCAGSSASGRSTDDDARRRRAGRHLRRPLRGTSCGPSTASPSATGPSRSRCPPSAAGSPAAAPASSRTATARSRTSSLGLDVVLADGTEVHTGGHARQAVGPDLTQLFVGSEGTLGVITGARLRAWPVPAGRAPGRVRVRHLRGRRSRPAAASCAAALTPAVLRLYDAVEADRSYGTGDRRRAARARRGRPRRRRRRHRASSTPSAPRSGPSTSTSSWSSTGWATATTSSALEAADLAAGYVVDTMELSDPWHQLPALYVAVRDAIAAVPGVIAVLGAPLAQLPRRRLPLLHLRRPASRGHARGHRRPLPRLLGRRRPHRAGPRRIAQPPPRRRPEPGPLRGRGPRRRRLRRARRHEAGPRPHTASSTRASSGSRRRSARSPSPAPEPPGEHPRPPHRRGGRRLRPVLRPSRGRAPAHACSRTPPWAG